MVEILRQIAGKNNVFLDEPLSRHSTFGIGGNARFFITPENYHDMFAIAKLLESEQIKFKVVGNASNILFSDSGYNGAIISTSKIQQLCELGGGEILASAGVKLSSLVAFASEKELSGLEFASGIPGTVGGAIFMNAGAFGKSMSNIVTSVTYYDGKEVRFARSDKLHFAYRSSLFKQNPEWTIMFCELRLEAGQKSEIKTEIAKLREKRKNTQPFGKSAGSVFKMIDGIPAGKLIDECGLKGLKVGDAEVSNMHANFIINNGHASSEDVVSLIEAIKTRVNEKYNKLLELEIEIVR